MTFKEVELPCSCNYEHRSRKLSGALSDCEIPRFTSSRLWRAFGSPLCGWEHEGEPLGSLDGHPIIQDGLVQEFVQQIEMRCEKWWKMIIYINCWISEVPNIFGTQISLQAPKGNNYSVPSTTFDHPRVFGYFGMSRTRDWETVESFDPAHRASTVYLQFCSLKQWFCRADTHVLLLEFPCLLVELTNHANLKVKRLNSIPSCCTPWWPGCHSRRL